MARLKRSKRNFTESDRKQIAEYVYEEYKRRKEAEDRRTLDGFIKEIDRQIAMKPDIYYKVDGNGRRIRGKEWMPELEPPNQAQTLEILSADAMRMQAGNPWFAAHVALTDDYLDRVDFTSLIMGDRAEVPSRMDQDNANKLAQGVVDYWHRQYNFWGNVDLINLEAFKYTVGVGRLKLVTKETLRDTSSGVQKETQRFPVLVPRSLKHTYLDDSEHRLMNEGEAIGPAQIFETTIKRRDLEIAIKDGSTDPDREDGGWIKKLDIKADSKGNVKLLEYEGDLTCERSRSENLDLPNVVVTIACGENANQLIRLRFRHQPYSSYLLFPYHHEHIDSAYGSSPLVKGLPVQKASADALNRMMMSAALNTEPPIGKDQNDPGAGEIRIAPGEVWDTVDEVRIYNDISNPAAMISIWQALEAKYADVTGGNPARLGAQTISHTTRFAKQAELQRGTIRTVDYVDQTLRGPMTRLLFMEWDMGRRHWNRQNIYVDAYDGFLTLKKEHLPETVHFEVFGAGGAGEEDQKQQTRFAALQQVTQFEQLRAQALILEAQTGIKSRVDYDALIDTTLREGGWSDVDTLIRSESAVDGNPGGPAMAGGAGPPLEPAAGAAIQAGALAGLG